MREKKAPYHVQSVSLYQAGRSHSAHLPCLLYNVMQDKVPNHI